MFFFLRVQLVHLGFMCMLLQVRILVLLFELVFSNWVLLPNPSVLDFWKIKLEKASSTNSFLLSTTSDHHCKTQTNSLDTLKMKSPNACLCHMLLTWPNLPGYQEQSDSALQSEHYSSEPHVLTGLQIYISDVIVFVILDVFRISIINKGLIGNPMAHQ